MSLIKALFDEEYSLIQIQCVSMLCLFCLLFFMCNVQTLDPVWDMPFLCTLDVVYVFKVHIKYKKRVAHYNDTYNIYFGDFCTLFPFYGIFGYSCNVNSMGALIVFTCDCLQ